MVRIGGKRGRLSERGLQSRVEGRGYLVVPLGISGKKDVSASGLFLVLAMVGVLVR